MNISKEKTIEIAKIGGGSTFLIKRFYWEGDDAHGKKLIYEDYSVISEVTHEEAVRKMMLLIEDWMASR